MGSRQPCVFSRSDTDGIANHPPPVFEIGERTSRGAVGRWWRRGLVVALWAKTALARSICLAAIPICACSRPRTHCSPPLGQTLGGIVSGEGSAGRFPGQNERSFTSSRWHAIPPTHHPTIHRREKRNRERQRGRSARIEASCTCGGASDSRGSGRYHENARQGEEEET